MSINDSKSGGVIIAAFVLLVLAFAMLRPRHVPVPPAAEGDSGPPVPVSPAPPEEEIKIAEIITGDEFRRSPSSQPQITTLAPGWLAVPNRTGSFATLSEQVLGAGGDKCLQIDFHFDACGEKDSYGPLIISNPAGRAFAESLLYEYRKIYDEHGWQWSPIRGVDLSRTAELGVLDNAKRKGFAAVISEFLNVKDPKNGTSPIEWAKTAPGHQRLARALIAARARCGDLYDPLIGTIGHHGSRGTGGAEYQGYHERDLAESVFAAITYVVKHPEPTPPAFPVPGEKSLPDAYDKDWEAAEKPSPTPKPAPKKVPPKKPASRSGSAYSRSGSKAPACKT